MNGIKINKQAVPARSTLKKMVQQEKKSYFEALQWAASLQQGVNRHEKQMDSAEALKNPETVKTAASEDAPAKLEAMLQLLAGAIYNQPLQQEAAKQAVAQQILTENAIKLSMTAHDPLGEDVKQQLAQNSPEAAASKMLQGQIATVAFKQNLILQQPIADVAVANNQSMQQAQMINPEVTSGLAQKAQQQIAIASAEAPAKQGTQTEATLISPVLADSTKNVSQQLRQEPKVTAKNQPSLQLANADKVAEPAKFIQQTQMKQQALQGAGSELLAKDQSIQQEPHELLVLQAEQQMYKKSDGPVVIKVAESLETDSTSGALAEKLAARLTISRTSKQSGFILQLNPENLGKVQVEMLMQDGKALVEIICESAKAKQLLGNTIGDLQSILANRTGLEVQVLVAEKQALPQQQETQQDGKNQHPREQQERREQAGQEKEMSFLEQLRLRGQLIE